MDLICKQCVRVDTTVSVIGAITDAPAEIPERPDPGPGRNRVAPAKNPIPVGYLL